MSPSGDRRRSIEETSVRYEERLEAAAKALMLRKKVAVKLDVNIQRLLQELSNEITAIKYDPSDCIEGSVIVSYRLSALRKCTHYTISATLSSYEV